MDCAICKGACCESITLNVQMGSSDMQRFLELRTKPMPVDGAFHRNFECRCTALTAEGRCGIYAARPRICREFEPGGVGCLATVRERRTPEQYAAIAGPDDPPWEGIDQRIRELLESGPAKEA